MKFRMLVALLAGFTLVGCKTAGSTDDDTRTDPDEPVKNCVISLTQAEAADNIANINSNGSALYVALTLELSEPLDRSIEVLLGASNQAVSLYNTSHNTSFNILPESRYAFKDEAGASRPWITIPAGKTRSSVILDIKSWTNGPQGVYTYVLPVVVSSASCTTPAINKRLEVSSKPYYVVVQFDLPEPPKVVEPPAEVHIPVLRISTGNYYYDENRIKKDVLIPATMTVEDPEGLYSSVPTEVFKMEIKGRGNTTWGMAKKPYKIKLDNKEPLLGMPANKHFVLLANAMDKSLLRNNVAFRLSELAGMMWAPRWVPVELYVDNSYRGQYMLTEHVRVAKERVDIDVVGATEVEGGYLLNIDYKEQDEGKPGWLQLPQDDNHPGVNRLYFAFDDPESPTKEQKEWAKSYMNRVQDTIYKSTTLSTGYVDALNQVIDVDSFIQYFFVQEITKNVDGNLRLSSPIAIASGGGKLFFPCVWDFDLALGVAGSHGNEQTGANSSYQGWYVRNSYWLRDMFRNDEFCDLVKSEWNELYPKLASINDDVKGWTKLLTNAAMRDEGVWGGSMSYDSQVNNMLDFYNNRVEWMNTQINAGKHKYTDD